MNYLPHFPLLNISDFHDGDAIEKDLLYNDIIGERYIDKPHQHDFFLFMLFETGSGTHTIDFIDYEVSAGQIHLLFPGQIHKWNLSKETRAYQIMMNRKIFESIANALRFSMILYQKNPVINLNNACSKKVLYEFQSIKAELKKPDILWEIIKNRINLIALMISEDAAKIFDNQIVYHTKPILLNYISLINSHYRDEKLVAFYAGKLNISPNYLNILCKKHFNASATSLIHERLILEIKRMLLTSDHPIKEIAFDLGFYDVAYFSKFFKSHVQITPGAFRVQL